MSPPLLSWRRLTLRLLRETRWQTNEVTSVPVDKGSRIARDGLVPAEVPRGTANSSSAVSRPDLVDVR